MTRLLVLGMLDIQPMSGYDIQQMLKLNDAERWGGVLIGSIYHALKKMEQEKLIEVTSIEHTGMRQKAVYTITDSGRKHLQELTQEALKTSSVIYPSTLYSGLSFYHKLPEEDVVTALELQKKKVDSEYEAMKAGLELKNSWMQNNMPPMTKLMFDNMFGIIKLQQEFIEEALKLLKTDNNSKNDD